jgi:hypothetical protein
MVYLLAAEEAQETQSQQTLWLYCFQFLSVFASPVGVHRGLYNKEVCPQKGIYVR